MNTEFQPQNIDQLHDQNHLLTVELERRDLQLAAINTVAAIVSQSLDLELTLKTALDAVLSVIPLEAAAISLIDTAEETLTLRAQQGLKLDFVSDPMRIKLGEGLSGQAITEDRVVVSGDLAEDSRLAVPHFTAEHIKAQALIPMHARGKVIGVLSVMSHSEYTFADEELSVLRVIADQVGVALENARLYEETRHQEKRLNAVIHSAADAMIATDVTGRINLINEAASNYFDIRAEEVIGIPLTQAPLQPSLREELAHAIQDTGEIATMFEVTLKTGKTLTAVVSRLRSASIVDQGTYEDGWVVVFRDITHKKRAENTRIEFVQSAAHDLRNPLSVTLSALMMLGDYLSEDDTTVQEIHGIAVDAVNRMQRLLKDLLNLEEIQHLDQLELKPTEIPALLKNILRDMQLVFSNRQQTSELMVTEPLPAISLSEAWLRRAVTNYLSNASKYTQAGGHIILHSRIQNRELLIEVQDNGPGIAQNLQGGLFERFHRLPTSREHVEGTGLGLAIVKSVAEAHNGRVYVQSQPDKGSTFGLALPLD
jgi:PAS domain S-box-containing protein